MGCHNIEKQNNLSVKFGKDKMEKSGSKKKHNYKTFPQHLIKFSFALLLHNKAFSAGLSISEPISFCLVSMKAGSLLQATLGKKKQKQEEYEMKYRK